MFTNLLLDSNFGNVKDFIGDLTSTLGIDLFDEDIDNVVFATNSFLCNNTFIGPNGPFWYILQMAMCLGAMFAICVGGSMAYKMMVKGEPIDVLKILKVFGVAIVLAFWYPPSMTGTGSSQGSVLDLLAYIPNCIGSYTHDLYEAEAIQVQEKIYGTDGKGGLMNLIHERDTLAESAIADPNAASEFIKKANAQPTGEEMKNLTDETKSAKDLEKAKGKVEFAGTMIGFDKIVMFFSLVIYKIGWWSTIFCQQILLGMLTIFGPIMIAFSVLPKWEGAWAKWMIRYFTVHFYGAMLYFVGFYVLLLFDIVISVQIENLTAITANEGSITAYVQNTFLTGGYLLVASVVSLKCLNLVPDLAAWMIPEGDTAFSTRNFGEGVAGAAKTSIMGALPKL